MLQTKVTKIPVIVDALGFIQGTGMEDNIKKIPGKKKLEQIQKTILLSTAHILHKALSM
jgi:hypothetical protein